MTVGDRIRKQREILGITQTELAEKVNISKQTLYKYETNIVTNIPSDKIEKLAKELNVSESFLMGWEETSPNYLYTDEATNFMIRITKLAKDKVFVERMNKYMSLTSDNRKSIDDMIDFMYEKEKKDEK